MCVIDSKPKYGMCEVTGRTNSSVICTIFTCPPAAAHVLNPIGGVPAAGSCIAHCHACMPGVLVCLTPRCQEPLLHCNTSHSNCGWGWTAGFVCTVAGAVHRAAAAEHASRSRSPADLGCAECGVGCTQHKLPGGRAASAFCFGPSLICMAAQTYLALRSTSCGKRLASGLAKCRIPLRVRVCLPLARLAANITGCWGPAVLQPSLVLHLAPWYLCAVLACSVRATLASRLFRAVRVLHCWL